MDNHLRIEPQPAPDTAGLGPRDVLVSVACAAVGWVDLLMASGQYQHMPQPPYTPGLEYAGTVAWVGDEVSTLTVGQRVLSDGMVTGPRSSGAYRRYGGFARWAVAPEAGLFPLPASLSFAQGCSLISSYETAYHCLIARGRLQAGEVVLIHGASGATGLAAVHIARCVGATVIATGRSPDKLAVVAGQGAQHTVQLDVPDARGVVSFRDAVKDLTGGRGVDVVYDGVGGAISLESLRCVRFGARFLVVGWAATPDVARGRGQRGAPRANHLPTNRIMMKGLDVLGCPAVISAAHTPGIRTERQDWIFEQVGAGRIVPFVGGAYAFAEVREAMRAKWKSRHVGGTVLQVGPTS